MEIAQVALRPAEMRNWNSGKQPNGKKMSTDTLPHSDGKPRLNLNSFIGNLIGAHRQIQNLKQDIDRNSTGMYICMIQIHAIGGPVLILQVNHL